MKRWRILRNTYNERVKPWRGAVGIEVDEFGCVPEIICWFPQGAMKNALHVVELHNNELAEKHDGTEHGDGT